MTLHEELARLVEKYGWTEVYIVMLRMLRIKKEQDLKDKFEKEENNMKGAA